MATEMEMRVAKALKDELLIWSADTAPEFALALAKAAIIAMREPTQDMLDGYIDAAIPEQKRVHPSWVDAQRAKARTRYGRMIDAASPISSPPEAHRSHPGSETK